MKKENERITMLLPRCAGMLQFLTRFINQDVKLKCPKCGRVDRMRMRHLVDIEAVSHAVGSYNPPKDEKDIRAIQQGKERMPSGVFGEGGKEVTVFDCECEHRGLIEEFIDPDQS